MNIISIDLNWHPNSRRIAAAVADREGNVRTVIGKLSDSELLYLIDEIHAKENIPSLILLDVPIEGCKHLDSKHFRPVDLALVRNGFPLLPSSKAGQRGTLLKKRIQAITGRSTRIYEIYPYAVYKFLSYLSHKGALTTPLLHGARRSALLDEQFRAFWPPRYKRERNKRMRVKNMKHVLSLLTNPQIGLAFSSPLQAPLTFFEKKVSQKTLRYFKDVHTLEYPKSFLPTSFQRSRAENLSTLTDKYDACLGAIAGIYLANKSPFAKIVGNKDSGEILLLADKWLTKNLKRANIEVR